MIQVLFTAYVEEFFKIVKYSWFRFSGHGKVVYTFLQFIFHSIKQRWSRGLQVRRDNFVHVRPIFDIQAPCRSMVHQVSYYSGSNGHKQYVQQTSREMKLLIPIKVLCSISISSTSHGSVMVAVFTKNRSMVVQFFEIESCGPVWEAAGRNACRQTLRNPIISNLTQRTSRKLRWFAGWLRTFTSTEYLVLSIPILIVWTLAGTPLRNIILNTDLSLSMIYFNFSVPPIDAHFATPFFIRSFICFPTASTGTSVKKT